MTKLSPIVSEFETEEQAASYDRWFRAKVEKSLADTRPGIPHDQVMAELRTLIAEKSGQT
ncbi:stability determinant [Novosphingobium sp. JCM 18896]|uniref:type II toxin-antitoxin system RelB family antitoxin n=1 Tax=Novosphingobium sp. JCM 18896 TaxID=2989731 RepID=UPI002221CCA6|nr:stability determinant [Novosphingobium sp. JCM 18896]MCW1429732.1 stability determinant [Novosphingobium sp. JCM 18896]